MTGSLFTSEVLQSVAQEVEQEVTKNNVPAGDHVGVMQCYSVSCCVNIAPPTLRTLTMSLSTTGAVVSRTKMIQRSTSPQSMATSFSPQPLMGGASGMLHNNNIILWLTVIDNHIAHLPSFSLPLEWAILLICMPRS